jgi:hypothetical protein
MTVRVVKTEPDPRVIKKKICLECGAILEYTPRDVQERHGKDYSGGADGCRFIKCPNCNQNVILESW